VSGWDLDCIPGLLTELSDAMVDEMNWLSELDTRHSRLANRTRRLASRRRTTARRAARRLVDAGVERAAPALPIPAGRHSSTGSRLIGIAATSSPIQHQGLSWIGARTSSVPGGSTGRGGLCGGPSVDRVAGVGLAALVCLSNPVVID
jgi:hypothetical protein